MKHYVCWLLGSLLMVASCEGDGAQCGAACVGNVSLRLYKAQWAEGEHELIVRYVGYRRMREARCSFNLPGTDAEIPCELDGEESSPLAHVSVDATVNVYLDGSVQRGDIEIEIVPPEGAAKTKRVRPAYTEQQICGDVCVSADEVVDLDE